MTDWTYEIPDSEKYMVEVLMRLIRRGLTDLAMLLEGSTCTISHSGDFIGKGGRWNAYTTTVDFCIPSSKVNLAIKTINDTAIVNLQSVCDAVMPYQSGLDVREVTFTTPIPDSSIQYLVDDIEKILKDIPKKVKSEIIPDDIKDKANEMTKIYLMNYYLENALRYFIVKIAKDKHGDPYFSLLNLNSEIHKKIAKRKKDEEINRWIRVRGDSDIFYLDFDDLGAIIRNNWDLFKNYFPSQDWIVPKIKELSKCRNPVAHNCYLEENERKLVEVYLNTILVQISTIFQ